MHLMKEPGHPGFTILEVVIVMSIMAVTAAIALPRVADAIRHNRVNRAAMIVEGDLRTAFSVAGRQRAPVRLSLNTSTLTYTIADRLSGTTIRSRALGSTSEYKLSGISFSPAQIDIFPSGVSSGALTVTLTSGDYSQQVTASSVGFVRSAQ
jgi:prepilin-type N-terminal cleavage/methylation domain-containing protein